MMPHSSYDVFHAVEEPLQVQHYTAHSWPFRAICPMGSVLRGALETWHDPRCGCSVSAVATSEGGLYMMQDNEEEPTECIEFDTIAALLTMRPGQPLSAALPDVKCLTAAEFSDAYMSTLRSKSKDLRKEQSKPDGENGHRKSQSEPPLLLTICVEGQVYVVRKPPLPYTGGKWDRTVVQAPTNCLCGVTDGKRVFLGSIDRCFHIFDFPPNAPAPILKRSVPLQARVFSMERWDIFGLPVLLVVTSDAMTLVRVTDRDVDRTVNLREFPPDAILAVIPILRMRKPPAAPASQGQPPFNVVNSPQFHDSRTQQSPAGSPAGSPNRRTSVQVHAPEDDVTPQPQPGDGPGNIDDATSGMQHDRPRTDAPLPQERPPLPEFNTEPLAFPGAACFGADPEGRYPRVALVTEDGYVWLFGIDPVWPDAVGVDEMELKRGTHAPTQSGASNPTASNNLGSGVGTQGGGTAADRKDAWPVPTGVRVRRITHGFVPDLLVPHVSCAFGPGDATLIACGAHHNNLYLISNDGKCVKSAAGSDICSFAVRKADLTHFDQRQPSAAMMNRHRESEDQHAQHHSHHHVQSELQSHGAEADGNRAHDGQQTGGEHGQEQDQQQQQSLGTPPVTIARVPSRAAVSDVCSNGGSLPLSLQVQTPVRRESVATRRALSTDCFSSDGERQLSPSPQNSPVFATPSHADPVIPEALSHQIAAQNERSTAQLDTASGEADPIAITVTTPTRDSDEVRGNESGDTTDASSEASLNEVPEVPSQNPTPSHSASRSVSASSSSRQSSPFPAAVSPSNCSSAPALPSISAAARPPVVPTQVEFGDEAPAPANDAPDQRNVGSVDRPAVVPDESGLDHVSAAFASSTADVDAVSSQPQRTNTCDESTPQEAYDPIEPLRVSELGSVLHAIRLAFTPAFYHTTLDAAWGAYLLNKAEEKRVKYQAKLENQSHAIDRANRHDDDEPDQTRRASNENDVEARGDSSEDDIDFAVPELPLPTATLTVATLAAVSVVEVCLSDLSAEASADIPEHEQEFWADYLLLCDGTSPPTMVSCNASFATASAAAAAAAGDAAADPVGELTDHAEETGNIADDHLTSSSKKQGVKARLSRFSSEVVSTAEKLVALWKALKIAPPVHIDPTLTLSTAQRDDVKQLLCEEELCVVLARVVAIYAKAHGPFMNRNDSAAWVEQCSAEDQAVYKVLKDAVISKALWGFVEE